MSNRNVNVNNINGGFDDESLSQETQDVFAEIIKYRTNFEEASELFDSILTKLNMIESSLKTSRATMLELMEKMPGDDIVDERVRIVLANQVVGSLNVSKLRLHLVLYGVRSFDTEFCSKLESAVEEMDKTVRDLKEESEG